VPAPRRSVTEPIAEPAHPSARQWLQRRVLRHLVVVARSEGPAAVVFEVEVADVARALGRGSEAPACLRCTRRTLEALVGPESVLPAGPPRLDVLPCDGLAVPERYRVVFFADPGSIAPPAGAPT
jgi:hypothetical protein